MKMEDHFKQILNKAVANEPPVQGAWDRFEMRVRRARRIRLVASVAGAAAAIVAAVLVVPIITSKPANVFQNSPTPSPLASPASDPYKDWQSYSDSFGRYDVRYPPSWRQTYFEGADIQPPGVPGPAVGAPTFFVHITVEPGRFDKGADASSIKVRPDGRRYVRTETTEGTARIVSTFIEWGPDFGCFTASPANGYVVRSEALRVIVRGDTNALWNSYKEDGIKVADSIERSAPQSPREGVHGAAAAKVPADQRLSTLMAFLDARVNGSGAEQYLSAKAKGTFDAIATAANGRTNRLDAAFSRYRVISRTVVAGGERFNVQLQLREADTPTGCLSDGEDYTIAAGQNSAGKQRNAVITETSCSDPATCPSGLYRFRAK